MNRRIFLKLIAGLPFFAVAAKAYAKERETFLLDAPVAGSRYYEGQRLWTKLRANEEIVLVREPANPYDNKAAAVYWHNKKLGYIPRADNVVFANLLNQSCALKSSIHKKTWGAKPWERLRVQVKMMV